MNTLFRKQLMGGASATAALAFVVLAWVSAPQLLPNIALPVDDTASRLAFAAQWLLVPGWMLLAGVFGASRRGFYADAIEGTRTPTAQTLEINLRYNQNTIEQTILAAIAWTSLAVVLPHDELILIPAMAVLFALGRITFWIGYVLHPMGRTFGMSLTVLPTIFAFLALTWMALT
ncbi:MAG: MAPEG family protein [Micropepsaceae bacterium]